MDEKEKLQAIQNRDKSYDGKFIFGVKTTKIICRPGCPAKIPLEKNIVFFDTIEEAIEKGYRPCKRCKPELVKPTQEEMKMSNIIVLLALQNSQGLFPQGDHPVGVLGFQRGLHHFPVDPGDLPSHRDGALVEIYILPL